MKILFASDSYKGTLSSRKIAELLDKVTLKVFPDAVTELMPIADGGEGTMEIIVDQLGGSTEKAAVKDPLFADVTAAYGLLPENKAIIEMAAASGLTMVKPEQQNPLYTTTYGTGQLIKAALDKGVRRVTIAIGGSGTNDGGMGALTALGYKFYDNAGSELSGTGENLEKVCRIDTSNIHPAIRETHFEVMCDITNPLLGENGASYVFGPQKGADAKTVKRLDEGMKKFADMTAKAVGDDWRDTPGAGAAGGLGFALRAYLNAELKPGIEAVLDLLDFNKHLKGADLVITGEGRLDSQSVCGKVVSGVGKRCKEMNIPAVAIVGGLLPGYEKIYDCGICSVMTTINNAMPIEQALQNSEEYFIDASYRMFNMLKCGMNIGTSVF